MENTEIKTERRGRPAKQHTEGETRPCAVCRANKVPIEEPPVRENATRVAAERLVDEFIQKHVR